MAKLFSSKVLLLFIAILSMNSNAKAQLDADFAANVSSGCAPLIVSFSDISSGNPVSWEWNLGDGTISYLQNPSVTYLLPGLYDISLKITDALGVEATLTRLAFINVAAQPSVSFSASPVVGCHPLAVQFTDQSNPGTGFINLWQWDFGDGQTSTIQNPTHTFLNAGSYNITLRVRNNFGCISTLSRPNFIVADQGVTAGLNTGVYNSCITPTNVSFTNTSVFTGSANYLWSFGDGGTSTATNPVHTYNAPGTYSVQLIAITTAGCRDTITRTNLISFSNLEASFTSRDSVCKLNSLALTNTTTPAPDSVRWTFGDGTFSTALSPAKTYVTPGIKIIKLYAYLNGCIDSMTKTVTVLDLPVPTFTVTNTVACAAPVSLPFNNTSTGATTYLWQFGDATTSTVLSPNHTYTTPGSYDVTLWAFNPLGCGTWTRKLGVVKIQAPHAQINGLPVDRCAPLTQIFSSTVTSIDGISSYTWDFGDGQTSSLTSPAHTFSEGAYAIKLIVKTTGGCQDTATVLNGVIASNKPVIRFGASQTVVCANTPIQFTDSTIGGTSWLWDFGDGHTSTNQNPIHAFQNIGLFSVQLIVWKNGCSDTLRKVNFIQVKVPI
ncbi:MAG: PKD domain-containing protein, partial [Ferruginibacter sp.]